MNKNWDYLLPGCRLEERTYGGGAAAKVSYRGYFLLVEPGTGQEGRPAGMTRVTINAVPETEEDRAALEEYLVHLGAERKEISKLKLEHNSVVLWIKGGLRRRTLEETINPVIDEIVHFLARRQIRTGCAFCGAQEHLAAYALEGQGYYLCQTCGEKLQLALKSAQAEMRSRKSNLAAGLAGAVLGALLGIAVWFGIYQLGRISVLGGLVLSVTICKGYELLGKQMDRRGVAVCILTILAAAYLGNQLCWSYLVYQALAEEGITFLDANRRLWEVLEGADLTGEYMGQLLLSYVFTAAGGYSVLRQSYRKANGSYRYQKI